MALFYFACSVCGCETRKILDHDKVPEGMPCPVDGCGGKLARVPRGATSRSVEVLDSPGRGHRLERLVDAERLFKERAEKDKL